MDYVYFSEDPSKKQEIIEAMTLLFQILGNCTGRSDLYRAIADYPEFPEVSLYPFKKGDRVFFVGLCHPKKWLNHWCAKGIEVVVFCDSPKQFPVNSGYWSGNLKLCLSKVQSLKELVEGWQRKEQLRYIQQCFECLPKELQSAIVHRPSGSQWVEGMTGLGIAQLPWQRLPLNEYLENVHFDDCEYFHCKVEYDLGYQNMKLLRDIKNLSTVSVVEGVHGLELRSPEVTRVPTKEAWIIIGNAVTLSGEKILSVTGRMVWTAYPGCMAISIKRVPEFDGSLESLIAVKDKYAIAVKGV